MVRDRRLQAHVYLQKELSFFDKYLQGKTSNVKVKALKRDNTCICFFL